MRLLLIEDSARLRATLERGLRKAGAVDSGKARFPAGSGMRA
jgi:DNA-binding response OmpR family regulator